jgi:16S rRNA (uracil1498-N3)-methyltransferase
MQRFYVTFPLGVDLEITDPDIYHQLTRVMRVSVGESIILFDGDGSETEYEIIDITKKVLSLRGKERRFPKTENKKRITLYQALPNKIEKIEYIIEKWVEVGISHFIFFRSDFSQKLILSESKKERFLKIAREALEQCGGLVMPEIEFVEGGDLLRHPEQREGSTFLDSSAMPQNDGNKHNIVLDTTGISQNLREIPQGEEICIWVGPEGGWSDGEREKMKEKGFIFVRFWERVMRTETAGVVMAFALTHQ